MDICEDAYATTSNPLIITVWIVLIIQNILCIIGLLLITYFLIYHKLYHLHLRVLILSLQLSFFIRTLGTTYRGFDFLVKLIFKGNDKCNLLQDKTYCTIISSINSSVIPVFLYSFGAISVERIIASLFYQKYEKFSNIILPIIAVIGIWVQPFFKLYNTFTSPTLFTKKEKLSYCNSFTTKQANFTNYFTLDLPLCLIVFFVNLTLYLYCRQRIKTLDDTKLMDNRLTVKFALKELLSTTLIMAIQGIFYTIDLGLNSLFVYLIFLTNYNDTRSFAFAKELSALIIPVYILIYIGTFILLSDKIKQKICKIVCKKEKIATIKNNKIKANNDEIDKYFEIYKNTWA